MALRDIFKDRRVTGRLAPYVPLMAVSAGPLLLALFVLLGPLLTSPLYTSSGLGTGLGRPLLGVTASIDPNIAITSFALGYRAALELITGHLPLWNHYQGFGAPLLGEMQSAALFPPTLLLLLPSGQALEHIFLQWIAGLGTFLFLRRFGLGAAAAVAGAVLYEFNGVFATLRNAAFNPIAFLPWLMFGVEALRLKAREAAPYGARMGVVAVTAAAGALALYAGFPETVYLYSFLVVGWALFRMVGLSARQAGTLFLDLGAAAALALLLTAPLLAAFAAFLAEGHVGGHGESFAGMWQEKETTILYLLPYIYGTFLAAPDPRLAGLSISSGGYIALAPVMLAAASLCTPGHRAVKIFLSAWIVIAIGISHGWPVIYPAAMALPLMKLAIAGRYLNASWIFCAVILAALLVDQLPRLAPGERRRSLIGALIGTAIVAAACTVPAWEMLPRAWTQVRPAVVLSVAGGLLAAFCAAVAIGASSARVRIAALGAAGVEVGLLFVIPVFAYPIRGDIDRAAIAFLRENIGPQRAAKTDGVGLNANFGATFGIPLIHFDDLPSPRRTVDYVKTRIDPYADNIFLPEHPALPDKELAARRQAFRDQLPAYARAGVKYVMAAHDFHAQAPSPVIFRDERPIVLEDGQRLAVGSRHTHATVTLAAVTLRVSTFLNTTTGPLTLRLCTNNVCATAQADMASAEDGRLIYLPLDTPLVMEAGAAYTAVFEKRGATAAVIWTYPLRNDAPPLRVLESPTPVADAYGIDLAFIPAGSPAPVHASRSMAIFELPDPRPYASAPGCEVRVLSFDEMETSCPGAAQLTRLSVHMNGWSARVNGAAAPIRLVEDTFQAVDLPAGTARVSFRYAPPGFGLALAGAAAALAALIASFALAAVRRYRNAPQKPADGAVALP